MWSEGEVGSFSKHPQIIIIIFWFVLLRSSFSKASFGHTVKGVRCWVKFYPSMETTLNILTTVIYTQLPRNDRPDLDGAVLQCYQ